MTTLDTQIFLGFVGQIFLIWLASFIFGMFNIENEIPPWNKTDRHLFDACVKSGNVHYRYHLIELNWRGLLKTFNFRAKMPQIDTNWCIFQTQLQMALQTQDLWKCIIHQMYLLKECEKLCRRDLQLPHHNLSHAQQSQVAVTYIAL